MTIRKYKNKRFESIAPKVTMEDCDRIDDRLGMKLRADHSAFMFQVNGGVPLSPWFVMPKKSGRPPIRVDYFYAINAPEASHDILETSRNIGEYMPPGCVPFAAAGEDILIICCSGKWQNRIYVLPWMDADNFYLTPDNHIHEFFWMFVEAMRVNEKNSSKQEK